jgi:type I restriction enzyme M protein
VRTPEVEEQKANAVTAKDRLGVLRKANANASQMDACRVEIAVAEKAAREAQSRADAIDAAVYDLKAVNPREVANADTRSTEEILDSIESHGHTIKDGLARLKDLMSAKV